MLHTGEVIMVDIDGNAVPCLVLELERIFAFTSYVKLCDTGSGRFFWRSYNSLITAKRFSNQIVCYHAYADWMLSNRPDVTVKFTTKKPPTKKPVAAGAPKFTPEQLVALRSILIKKGIIKDEVESDE